MLITKFLLWKEGYRYDDFFNPDDDKTVAQWRTACSCGRGGRGDRRTENRSNDDLFFNNATLETQTQNNKRRVSSSSLLVKDYDDVIFMSAEFVEDGYGPPLEEDEEEDECDMRIPSKLLRRVNSRLQITRGDISNDPNYSNRTVSTSSVTGSSRSHKNVRGTITESGCYVVSSSFAEKRRKKMMTHQVLHLVLLRHLVQCLL